MKPNNNTQACEQASDNSGAAVEPSLQTECDKAAVKSGEHIGAVNSDESLKAPPIKKEITDEDIYSALKGERLERLIFSNKAITDEIIARYLDELGGTQSVPVVRGYLSVSAMPKPKTLAEAKAIVDKYGV